MRSSTTKVINEEDVLREHRSRWNGSGGLGRVWKQTVGGLAALVVVMIPLSAEAGRLDRHLERPAAQSNLATRTTPTSSFIERTIAWPADGTMEFDYFVDSEENHDFLRVYVDGVAKFSASGADRSGRPTIEMPAGSHLVRFEYFKDNSGNYGLDTAWVDNIRCASCNGVFATFRFNERGNGAGPSTPPGWTGGGTGSTGIGVGWQVGAPQAGRGIRRPVTLAFLGYQAVERKSSLQRKIAWPAGGVGNTCTFDYFVDSELGHDFLKVYVDDVVKFSMSGRNQSSRATIDVGAGGNHTIKFEYVKDVSVDAGLDDARVDNLSCSSGNAVFMRETFDAVAVGAVPAGWSAGDGCFHGDGWVGANPRLPRAYLAPGSPPRLPTVDGVLGGNGQRNEYANPTRIRLADFGSSTGAPGELVLTQSESDASLFFGLRAHSNTVARGNEKGELSIYVDSNHFATQKGFGCGLKSVSPGPEDRRFKISYNSANGQGQASVNVVQEVGTCGSLLLGTWRPAILLEKWPISVAVSESDDDRGFIHFEARIRYGLGSDAIATKKVGFAFSLQSAGPTGVGGVVPNLLRLPWTDGAPPSQDDVSSWESIFFGNNQTDDLRGIRVDGAPRG